MRPASNSTSVAANGAVFQHWNSPIPYLFGGIAAMLGLIAIALVILACSCKNSPNNPHGDEGDDEEKSAKQRVMAMQLEMEPKIVVIMAGDENPTYIANPTRHNEQQV